MPPLLYILAAAAAVTSWLAQQSLTTQLAAHYPRSHRRPTLLAVVKYIWWQKRPRRPGLKSTRTLAWTALIFWAISVAALAWALALSMPGVHR